MSPFPEEVMLIRLFVLSICIAAGLAAWNGPLTAQAKGQDPVAAARSKLTSKNPDVRAEAVETLSRHNNRAATEAILIALGTENDGPAGFRMADAVANLNSPEALDVIEKQVMGWTTPEKLFGAYWCFCGIARMNSERADAFLGKVINQSKEREIYIRAAVIEALARAGRSDKADLLADTIAKYEPAWDQKNMILTLTCIYNAPRLVDKADTKVRDRVVLALADVLEKTKDDRVIYFLAKALAEVTGEDTYIDPVFWRWWVEMGGRKVERKEGGDGNTVAGRDVPKFFKAAAVGKRVMFVIDISGSMQHPVTLPPESRRPPPPPPKKEEKDGPVTGRGEGGDSKKDDKKKDEPAPIPPPDYSKVKSKLDLAKVELIHTLKHLPEDYLFNIVIYHTDHSLLDQGIKNFIPATRQNRDRMIGKVERLAWAQLTNIHGALIRSFCVNEKGMIDQKKQNPGWDPGCMATGATTIFFLTDGSPTISDDTTNIEEIGRTKPVGNGRMCNPGNIIEDIRRVNTFRKAVINTIGIGPHNGRLLAALARMSGGEYIDRSGVARRGD